MGKHAGGSPRGDQGMGSTEGRDEPSAVASTPSWASVLGTTLRLWAARRTRQITRGMSPGARNRWRIAAVVVVSLAVLAAVAVPVALSSSSQDASARRDGGDGAVSAAAADRVKAAVWVAQQVSRSAIVACDPAMCNVLAAHGVPAANLLQLGTGAGDPLGSTVVVATAVIRNQFGDRLADVYAPDVLASFGSGAAQVQIRVTAPDGAAAYLTSLRADLAARQKAGRQLLHNANVVVSGSASRELAAGQVDSRLLITLATLAARRRVRVVAFGDSGPGASPGIPLRSAELAIPLIAVGAGRGYLRWVLAFIRAQQAPYRVASAKIGLVATKGLILRIEFAAPSPVGLLGTASDLASERR
jgi:hypothetical protein